MQRIDNVLYYINGKGKSPSRNRKGKTMTSSEITTKIKGGKVWEEGVHSRVYVGSLLKLPYNVGDVFVDCNETATLGMYDYTEETDSGLVVVVCDNRLSTPKKSQLQDQIWALLDN